MKSSPQVSLFNINSIEIIYAPRKSGQTWHAEQRSISGSSKLIEQTLDKSSVARFPTDKFARAHADVHIIIWNRL